MKNVKISLIQFYPEKKLQINDIPLFRGYLAQLFRENDLVHNHDPESGKYRYRYPQIQYKILDGIPTVVAINNKAIEVAKKMICQIRQLKIGRQWVKLTRITMKTKNAQLGSCQEPRKYQMVSPWIGLNTKNYLSYRDMNEQERDDLLSRCLIGNFLSICKYLGHNITDRLQVKLDIIPQSVYLKKEHMIGFTGTFESNFYLPDYLGLGRCSSRGYGCCINLSPFS